MSAQIQTDLLTQSSNTSDAKGTKQVIVDDINSILANFFVQHIEQAQALHSRYAELIKFMADLNKAGGKRMRPYLTVQAYKAYGGKSYKDIRYVAAAQEMIHFAMLIHDDIIDRDFARYAVANISGKYRDLYQKQANNNEDVTHYANSAAMLAGDVAIAGAYELIAKSEFNADARVMASQLMSKTIFTVAGGELIDTDELFYDTQLEDPLITARIKTAYYSFTAPLLVGAKLAGASEEQCRLLEQLGEAVGVAFQLSDDILGIYGKQKLTGKSVDGDMREGKRTYLYMLAQKEGTSEHKHILNLYYGNPYLTDDQADQVRMALKDSGAYEKVEQKIKLLAAQAHDIASKLTVNESTRHYIYELIHNAAHRDF